LEVPHTKTWQPIFHWNWISHKCMLFSQMWTQFLTKVSRCTMKNPSPCLNMFFCVKTKQKLNLQIHVAFQNPKNSFFLTHEFTWLQTMHTSPFHSLKPRLEYSTLVESTYTIYSHHNKYSFISFIHDVWLFMKGAKEDKNKQKR
jgi:hypothetical protein